MHIKFLDIQKIFILIATVLMYTLGGGSAHYLGADFHPVEFWLGLLWVISVHISGFLLILNSDPDKDLIKDQKIIELFGQKTLSILQLSILFLAFSGVYIAILLLINNISIYIGALIALTLLGLVLYSIPPFNLSRKGYLEIGLALFQGCLVPAIGFFILAKDFHRMIFSIVFPMTLLALAFYIALNFSTFALDLRIGRKSFVQVNTWQRSVPVHHILLLSGYLFFILGFGMGIPKSITWITLLTFPLAIFQIFWLARIVRGGRPFWPLFNILAASVYGLSAYLVAFTLWIN